MPLALQPDNTTPTPRPRPEWKFLLERADDVEKAIVSSRAVPLVHTTNNSEQIRAALWMASSIQSGHPPDVIEKSMTTGIIIASVAGGSALLLLIFIAHVVTTKHAMERNPRKGVDVQKIVQRFTHKSRH